MSTGAGSIVARRSLGRRLRGLRRAAGKTAADVEAAHIASRSKLDRIENRTGPVFVPDVEALCRLYGADDETTGQLVALTVNTTEQGWWENYGDAMPSWFTMYVELESAATTLQTWQCELIPGLLQTPDYQRAIAAADPALTPEAAERQVRLRTERQRAVLDRGEPLNVTAVLGAGAVQREVGGSAVLAAQLEHLLQMSTRDHVTVLVLPWSAGAHVAMKSAFNLLGFTDPEDPDVVYLETEAGGRYVEQPPTVERFRGKFGAIRELSIPIEEYKP